MKWSEYKKKALEDPKFKKEYERFDLVFEINMFLIETRLKFWKFIYKLLNKPT